MWEEDLERAVALGTDHLSVYLLETDKETPLARLVNGGSIEEPDAVTIGALYRATESRLPAAGFSRYEVSNWARPGRASRHNLGYWSDRPYLGFGASAHSYYLGLRRACRLSAAAYASAVERGEETREALDDGASGTRLSEAIVTALRLTAGADFDELGSRYGVDLWARHGADLERLVARGWAALDPPRVRLTIEGILWSMEALAPFAPDPPDATGGPEAGGGRQGGWPDAGAGPAVVRGERGEVGAPGRRRPRRRSRRRSTRNTGPAHGAAPGPRGDRRLLLPSCATISSTTTTRTTSPEQPVGAAGGDPPGAWPGPSRHFARLEHWHPLTWLSHMLDCQLYGLEPGWHHLTSLLLHAAEHGAALPAVRRAHGTGGAGAPSWPRCSRFTRCTSNRSRGSRSARTFSALSSGSRDARLCPVRRGPVLETIPPRPVPVPAGDPFEADGRDVPVRASSARLLAARGTRLPVPGLASPGRVDRAGGTGSPAA